MKWPSGWTKPSYHKTKGNLRGYFSPLTPTKVGGSVKIGPVSFTGTGRIYLFGARIK